MHNVSIESLTADCFMQAPFWKCEYINEKKRLKDIFIDVISAAKKLDIKYIVVPLVDNGSIDNVSQENDLVSFLISIEKIVGNIKILFESDLPPKKLEKFIGKISKV